MSPIAYMLSIGSWFVVCRVILKAGSELDDRYASSYAKRCLTHALKMGSSNGFIVNISASFESAFDRVFGVRHFTARCFFRSCAFSLIATVAASVPIKIIPEYRQSLSSWSLPELVNFGWSLSFVALIFNVIPDYFSLLETRHVIRLIQRSKSLIRTVLLLFIDVVSSVLIFSLYSIGILWFFVTIFPEYSEGLPEAPVVCEYPSDLGLGNLGWIIKIYLSWIGVLGNHTYVPVWGETRIGYLFLSTTFATSVWLWLHLVGGFSVRIPLRYAMPSSFAGRLLNVDEKPFSVLSVAVALVWTVLYWLFVIF